MWEWSEIHGLVFQVPGWNKKMNTPLLKYYQQGKRIWNRTGCSTNTQQATSGVWKKGSYTCGKRKRPNWKGVFGQISHHGKVSSEQLWKKSNRTKWPQAAWRTFTESCSEETTEDISQAAEVQHQHHLRTRQRDVPSKHTEQSMHT